MSKVGFGDSGVVSQSMGEKQPCSVYKQTQKRNCQVLPWKEFRVLVHPRWRWDLMKKKGLSLKSDIFDPNGNFFGLRHQHDKFPQSISSLFGEGSKNK
jgi:hypothetical protein